MAAVAHDRAACSPARGDAFEAAVRDDGSGCRAAGGDLLRAAAEDRRGTGLASTSSKPPFDTKVPIAVPPDSNGLDAAGNDDDAAAGLARGDDEHLIAAKAALQHAAARHDGAGRRAAEQDIQSAARQHGDIARQAARQDVDGHPT